MFCQMFSSSSLVKLIVFDKQKTGKTNKNTKTTGEPSTMAAMRYKWYLCNQVDDIAGNEVSPTKQARGEKKPWEKPGSVGGRLLMHCSWTSRLSPAHRAHHMQTVTYYNSSKTPHPRQGSAGMSTSSACFGCVALSVSLWDSSTT